MYSLVWKVWNTCYSVHRHLREVHGFLGYQDYHLYQDHPREEIAFIRSSIQKHYLFGLEYFNYWKMWNSKGFQIWKHYTLDFKWFLKIKLDLTCGPRGPGLPRSPGGPCTQIKYKSSYWSVVGLAFTIDEQTDGRFVRLDDWSRRFFFKYEEGCYGAFLKQN
jgi:hypothetical protein